MPDNANESAGDLPARTAKVIPMSSAIEARELFIEIAGPMHGSAWVKQAVEKVSRATGLSHRRLRGIWGNEVKRLTAEELDALRIAARKQEARTYAIASEAFAARLEAVEARLASIDPTFFGDEIARLGNVASRIRRIPAGGR